MMFIAATLAMSGIPDRPLDFQVTSAQARDELALCIARKYKASPVSLAARTVIDVKSGPVMRLGTPYSSFLIEEVEGRRLISITYRHPMSKRNAMGQMRGTAKKCFASEFNDALTNKSLGWSTPL